MYPSLIPANILLPDSDTDLSKWAVIACDQYTSQPEYWHQVESTIGHSPSSYNIIYPEVYLGENNSRIDKIHNTMSEYIEDGILTEKVHEGFVLVERTVSGRTRVGIIGAIDLDAYEYKADCKAAVRATEGTILSRIPPRVEIRRNAPIETSHVMVLLNDKKKKIIEHIYANKDELEQLYDFELMLGGGHIRGFAITGEKAQRIADEIQELQNQEEIVFAIGDGNHSIAAAKAYWEEISKNLPESERKCHPARFALAEVVNLYSPATIFEPIHRIVFRIEINKFESVLRKYFIEQNTSSGSDSEIIIVNNSRERRFIPKACGQYLSIELVQNVLDEYLSQALKTSIDYIHGEENVRKLCEQNRDSTGILLKGIPKGDLFSVLKTGQVLPRKSFSMGEANEKRYYVECRKIAGR